VCESEWRGRYRVVEHRGREAPREGMDRGLESNISRKKQQSKITHLQWANMAPHSPNSTTPTTPTLALAPAHPLRRQPSIRQPTITAARKAGRNLVHEIRECKTLKSTSSHSTRPVSFAHPFVVARRCRRLFFIASVRFVRAILPTQKYGWSPTRRVAHAERHGWAYRISLRGREGEADCSSVSLFWDDLKSAE
jgi:hypothetical protein